MTVVPTTPEVGAARKHIEAADLLNSEAMGAIEGVRFTQAGEDAARAVLESSASADALWAATWVYASSATDLEPLRPLLGNPDPSIRAMAAAALVAGGDAAGLDVIAALLSDGDQLRGSEPPMSAAAFAVSTLIQYVQAPDVPAPPADEGQLSAVGTAWSAWLKDHEIHFDAANGTWTT